MSLTDEQLAERRAYLGGSDAPAIAGMNPPGWSQPIDVWLEKRPDLAGDALPARRTSALMGLGSLLEPVVAELFTTATGIRLRKVHQPVRSRQWPWMGGHLDRRAPGAIFEAKWSHSDRGWGPSQLLPDASWAEVPAEVPPHYYLQVQHYLAVTQAPVAYVGLLLGYAEFRAYRLHADAQLQPQLVELERRFWHENVLAGVPPEPDGSDSYGRVIRDRLAHDRGTEAVATPEQAAWARDLLAARRQREAAAREEERLKQRLQLSMGEVARLVGPGFTISYSSHPVRTTRWREVAEALAGNAGARVLERLREDHTTTRTDRPFRPTWDEEEDEHHAPA